MSVLAEPRGLATRVSTRPATLAAHGGLAVIVAAGLWIALGAASSDTIVDTANADAPRWVAGALHGLAPGLTDTGFSVAMIAMLAGYVLVVALAQRIEPRLLVAAIAATVVALALAPPLLSSDIFGYVAYARLGTLHNLNPYTHGPIAAPQDPVFGLVYWQHPSTPYGPLFTLGTYALGHASPALAVWTLKAAAALACLAAVALISRAAALLDRPRARAIAILGANPVLLVFGVGGGHNDLLVLAAVTAALALLAAHSARGGGVALVTAIAIKATAGLALPFALLGARPRRRLLLCVGIAAAVGLVATLAFFGPHVLDTPFKIAIKHSFDIAYSGPDLLGRLLGTGISAGVRATGAILLAAVGLLSLLRVARGGDWITAAGWTALAALIAIPSFVPWYIAWLLPFAALAPSRRLVPATLVLTAVVIATHMPLMGFDAYQ